MNGGWIRLPREIISHPVFQGRADWLGAFVWLVGKACWKETPYRMGAETITLGRGQCVVTLASMAAETGLSVRQIRWLTQCLTKERMIDTRSGKHGTIVTVCNYDDFQANGEASVTPNGTRVSHGVSHPMAHECHTKERMKESRKESEGRKGIQL